MKWFPHLFAVSLALSPVLGQRDMSVNTDAVLREIDNLEQKQKQAVEGARSAAIRTLRGATGGGTAASNLYQQAVEATSFQGRRDRVPAFNEWKKKNADLLRSSEFQAALGLHVRYLLLTMERAPSEEPGEFAGPSFDYAVELGKLLLAVDALEKPAKEIKEVLDKPITDSLFTKWMALGPWLYSGKDWENIPGNLGGALEKNVRMAWRESGEKRLIDTHDFQIQYEADRISVGRLEHASETFQTLRRPNMVFARANDIAAMGLPNNAINEILALVRSTPQHPDFSKWTARIRELLETPSPAEGNQDSGGQGSGE